MVVKMLRTVWSILKNTPVINSITFFILRNSRYIFWRYRGRKPVQLGPANKEFLKRIKSVIGSDSNFKLIEFGCAAGPTLIELAKDYPNSNLFGFDIRKGAIYEGNKFISENNIKNLELRHKNLLELDDGLGCDYLISRATLIYLSNKDLRILLENFKTSVNKKIIFQEIESLTGNSIKHYFFAHPFESIFEELGYSELFNINIEEMDFPRWKKKSWRGVNIVLERKTL